MAGFGGGSGVGGGGGVRQAVPHPPEDTVTRVRFSPTAENHLLAASWAGDVRVWQAQASGAAAAVERKALGAPVLDACWGADGRRVVMACADGRVQHWDVAAGAVSAVGAHDQPARCVQDVPLLNCVATGSWDKSLRYWDLRKPGAPVGTVQVPDRVYALDARGPVLVAALADRKIVVYDVRKPAEPFVQKFSQLRWQSRTVATFPDSMGYVLGSVAGRASIDHVRPDDARSDFTFTCHRADGRAHAVNAIRFHMQSGALVTAGSDGNVRAWDKKARKGVSSLPFERVPAPISDIDFSHDGALMAFAVGYDWAQGAAGAPANRAGATAIFLQPLHDRDFEMPRDGRGNGNARGGHNRGRGRGRGGRNRGRGRGRGGGGGGNVPMR